MTKRSFLLLCAIGLFPLAVAVAQTPPPMPRPLPVHTPADENYVLSLSPAGKDGEGASFIVTSTQSFNTSRPGLVFNGTLGRTDNGALRLDFLLETNAEGGGVIHTGASVLLTPGEPVQLVRNGNQFYNLRLEHYPPATPAKSGHDDDKKSGPGVGFRR